MKTEEVVHLLENVYKYNISELSIKSGDEKIITKMALMKGQLILWKL